ncbi:transglutaminase domain-containing protein [Aquimarina brevivitae]|uniref:Transglutaminase superfamily protein n=1 Tax=Aquimarina brevivitae TaxID=323412 RepID=A0A4Q7P1D4_9FLAO|nr:transglutaminase domain-containing protein [Aquimarina brevivitae]RZS93180.1 transglutaminase superfamily protein [Aquimarina brevivitae]
MKLTRYLLPIILSIQPLFAQVSDFAAVDFTKADNRAQFYYGASLDNLPVLAHQLTKDLSTDVEKFRAIYLWVCQNIKGDNRQFLKVERQRNKLQHDSISFMKWNYNYARKAFKKLLKYKATMCTGYAYLLKELCYLANLPCEIVDGYGRTVSANVLALDTPNHSWNAVQLNGKWYVCDATWASGYLDEYYVFIKAYNDGYFLTDPTLFAKNHFPLDKKWLLDATLTATEFVNAPLVYGESFATGVSPIYPKTMDIETTTDKATTFSIGTNTDVLPKNVALVLYLGPKEKELPSDVKAQKDNILTISHRFKIKGTYDVHLKIDDAIIATYTVKVKKV